MNSITYPNKLKVLIGLFITATLFGVAVAGPKAFNPGLHLNITESGIFIISRLLLWILLLLTYFYATRIEKQPLLIWKEQHYRVVFYIVSVIVLLICVIAGGTLINILIASLKLNHVSKSLVKLIAYSIPLKLLAVVTAAVVEEYIFRGYFIPRLQLYIKNYWLSILVSAFMFGLAHIGYGTINNLFVPIFIGLVFGYHYYKYKNLKVLIVCHALIDFYALLLQHSN